MKNQKQQQVKFVICEGMLMKSLKKQLGVLSVAVIIAMIAAGKSLAESHGNVVVKASTNCSVRVSSNASTNMTVVSSNGNCNVTVKVFSSGEAKATATANAWATSSTNAHSSARSSEHIKKGGKLPNLDNIDGKGGTPRGH